MYVAIGTILLRLAKIAESYILIGTFISFVGLLTMMSPLSNMYKLTHKLFFCAGGGVIVFSVYTWNLMLPEPPETYMFWGLMPIVLILIGSALFIGGTIGLVEYLYHSAPNHPTQQQCKKSKCCTLLSHKYGNKLVWRRERDLNPEGRSRDFQSRALPGYAISA